MQIVSVQSPYVLLQILPFMQVRVLVMLEDIPPGSNISNPSTNPASSNSGCLQAGELNPQWLIVTVGNPGTLEFVFGSLASANPQVGYYDWAMWPYNASTCSGIFNNTLPPIRCNWNGSSLGGTGIASAANTPTGGSPLNFEPPLTVNGCQQYIICISNFSGVNTLVSFQSLGTASLSCNPNCLQVNSPQICAGKNATIIAVSSGNLANINFSLNPGGLSSPTPTFVVTPTVNTTYTVYATGLNTSSVSVTQTAITTVTVDAQPFAAPTLTQSTCTNTFNAFNLGLTFFPVNSNPSYTVGWSPTAPPGLAPGQTTLNGGIPPGLYSATITAAGGCSAVTSVSINSTPAPPIIALNPPGSSHSITCYQPTVTITPLNANYTYTWSNGLIAPITTSDAAFTSTMTGSWTITAINPASGCIATQTIAIGINTVVPTSAISPTFQNITCSVTSISNVSTTASPSVNITQQILSPLGGTFATTSYTSLYTPGVPGTYTYCVTNGVNGCSDCKNFTVTSNQGFPTFLVNSSPPNFTLGCTTTSVLAVNILSASATNSNQIPTGGPVSYTILAPNASSVTPSGTLSGVSNPTVNVPGTWTVVVKDNNSFCETRLPISILSNTVGPDIVVDTINPVLSCYQPQVTLKGSSSLNLVTYSWGLPGNLSQPGDTLTVYTNTASITNTLVGNYTLSIVNNNSTCKSTSVVPIYQSIFPPKAGISPLTSSISCTTGTVILTNQSSSAVPPNFIFPPTKPVVGLLWEGPTPLDPLQLSTTYVGNVVGIYTLTVKDLNNGCTSKTIATVSDNRVYPTIDSTGSIPPPIDCGSAATLAVHVSNLPSNLLSYTWTTPTGATVFPSVNSPSITAGTKGIYRVLITNTNSGCSTNGFCDCCKW